MRFEMQAAGVLHVLFGAAKGAHAEIVCWNTVEGDWSHLGVALTEAEALKLARRLSAPDVASRPRVTVTVEIADDP